MPSPNELLEIRSPKFKDGEVVFEITRPHQLMLITKRTGLIYSCRSLDNSKDQEVVFMERDLKKQNNPIIPKIRSHIF